MRRTPMLPPSHWEGAAWEPAAVARLNKPSYRLTLEEQATHLHPLPAQPHEAQEQAQGGVRPPGAAGDPEVTAVADGALRGMEHMWEASAQQGSQPPRWLDTPVRACPRPSREERFKGKDPELDAAHFDQLWPKASWG
ncbi:hypothetical protein V8C86DRAFT_3103473 [Haematococcus lacustris]